ncbi:MAG: class I SAM-dependent methyltransferase [Elusimicrobia bacterium]|nr:class I SAM-dependent methyltransferase [Elusimicrobiota bacterium]
MGTNNEMVRQTMLGIYEQVLSILKTYPNVSTVLDIPAGSGLFTSILFENKYKVYAADILPEKMSFEKVKCVFADMNKRLPFEDNFFDAVVCLAGIEHVENPMFTLSEFFRILSPKGIFILDIPNINSLYSRVKFLLTGGFFLFDPFWLSEHNHISVLPPYLLNSYLEKNKFQEIRIYRASLKSYYIWLHPLITCFFSFLSRILHKKFPLLFLNYEQSIKFNNQKNVMWSDGLIFVAKKPY